MAALKVPLQHTTHLYHSVRVSHTTEDFIVTGINYKKSDAVVRGQFAVNSEQYASLLETASSFGISDMFVLSTCNRTEIYGFAAKPECFADLICSVCAGSPEMFGEMAYTRTGTEAITHLYRVAAGLDSQILGDYEILGQIKTAVKQARAAGFIAQYMDRVIGSVLQASKAIKTHTVLSGGTVSVSFAAIQYIKEYAENRGIDPADMKIALVGTGKIGRVSCRNILDYLQARDICLINRTEATAQELAAELGLRSAPLSELAIEVNAADVILVSTNATSPVITAQHLDGNNKKLIIDISVPCNVSEDAQKLPGVTFVDVDELSRIKDKTLQKRSAEVPKALTIIDQHIAEFNAWCDMRRHAPVIKEMKNKLMGIPFKPVLLCDHQHTGNGDKEIKVQKVLNDFAVNIRTGNTPGCHYIKAINDLIA